MHDQPLQPKLVDKQATFHLVSAAHAVTLFHVLFPQCRSAASQSQSQCTHLTSNTAHDDIFSTIYVATAAQLARHLVQCKRKGQACSGKAIMTCHTMQDTVTSIAADADALQHALQSSVLQLLCGEH